MKFTKGQSGNPAGRPSHNQSKQDYNDRMETRIEKYLEKNFDCLETLETSKDLSKARIYCEILKYSVARLAPKRSEARMEDLSTEQLEKMSDQLLEKSQPEWTVADLPGLRNIKDDKEFVKKLMELMKK